MFYRKIYILTGLVVDDEVDIPSIFFNKLKILTFKIKNYFANKDPIPNGLKSFLVYKFTCAGCSSSYIGKNCRHFITRIEENIKKDNKSRIFFDSIVLFILK